MLAVTKSNFIPRLNFHKRHRHRHVISFPVHTLCFPKARVGMVAMNSTSFSSSYSFANPSNDSSVGSFLTLSGRIEFEREIKKSKFIAIAGPISDERSAFSFLSEVSDPRATHNCWAYKIQDQFRSNDDGEPSGTAGKPIHSAIAFSGLDRVMVVVRRYFGGIKLGTGGLVRAYSGVAAECLKNAPTCVVKSKIWMGLEIPYDIVGVVYHQLQGFEVEDMKEDYDTGKENITLISFKVDFDRVRSLEEALRSKCSRQIVVVFYKP